MEIQDFVNFLQNQYRKKVSPTFGIKRKILLSKEGERGEEDERMRERGRERGEDERQNIKGDNCSAAPALLAFPYKVPDPAFQVDLSALLIKYEMDKNIEYEIDKS